MSPPLQGYSSLGRSIAANNPNYPPPTESNLDPSNFRGISPMADMNPPVFTRVGSRSARSAVVSSKFLRKGMRYLYSRGSQLNDWFHMRATGQVESSAFQPMLSYTWAESFNDDLFRPGGYPRNLGLSFKVPTIPDGTATNPAWGRMRQQPQFRRTIYTRRRYSVAPSLPAESTP